MSQCGWAGDVRSWWWEEDGREGPEEGGEEEREEEREEDREEEDADDGQSRDTSKDVKRRNGEERCVERRHGTSRKTRERS